MSAVNGSLPTVHTINGNKLLLNSFSEKLSQGRELTGMESNMAITSSNIVRGNRFGPGPAEMTAGETILPERIEGMIAAAVG